MEIVATRDGGNLNESSGGQGGKSLDLRDAEETE